MLGFTPLSPYDSQEQFDERRTGLDHLSFAVRAEEDLAAWTARLDAAGVAHVQVGMPG